MATATITSRPIYTVDDGSPVIKSRWIAGWNPVVYEFSFSGIVDDTTYLLVSVHEYGSNTLLGVSNYRPVGDTLMIDISNEVRSYLYSLYNPDFSNGINCRDLGSSIGVYIKYQLNTLEESGTAISDESNYIFVANAAKQIGQEYGQNMAEYVPYGFEGIIKAKFLTKFDEPIFFTDYPFTLSFIYSEAIVGHELFLTEEEKNINRSFINNTETELDITQGFYINHLRLQDNYDGYANYVDLSISTGQPSDELYVYEGYVETGYTEAR